jgi:hypothetical protein
MTDIYDTTANPGGDNVDHPSHYADGWSNGAEVIDITEHLNFNRGNAVKYIARAGKKNPDTELEDLRKAQWYINREIRRIESGTDDSVTQVIAGFTKKPNVYGRLSDVPSGVVVVDKYGDKWYRDELRVFYQSPGDGWQQTYATSDAVNRSGPFEEVS